MRNGSRSGCNLWFYRSDCDTGHTYVVLVFIVTSTFSAFPKTRTRRVNNSCYSTKNFIMPGEMIAKVNNSCLNILKMIILKSSYCTYLHFHKNTLEMSYLNKNVANVLIRLCLLSANFTALGSSRLLCSYCLPFHPLNFGCITHTFTKHNYFFCRGII